MKPIRNRAQSWHTTLGAPILALVLAAVTACGSAAPSSAPAQTTAGSAKPAASSAQTSAATEVPATLDALYAAAKKEGALQTSLSWQDDQWLPLAKAFSDRYPGIKLDRLEISPDKGLERIITEKAAGKVSTDLAGARLSEMTQVISRDLAATYDYRKVFGLSNDVVQDDNRYVIAYQNGSILSYNTKLLDDASAPKDWKDLLDPRFQGGKVIVAQDANDVFWALAKEWGRDTMLDFARKLAAQKPRFSRSASDTTSLLIAGDAPVALSLYAGSIMKYTAKGAPIKGTAASPVSVDNNGVWVLKDAAHPNAARLFAGWLATPEAQNVFDTTNNRSLLIPGTSTKTAQYVQSLGVKLIMEQPTDIETDAKTQADAMAIIRGKNG